MFLDKLCKTNSNLIQIAVHMHQQKQILPDTYVVDVDRFLENAKVILQKANEQNIELYYMLKQIGRNPYLAKELEKIGYKGAVVVDFKEAEVMMKNHLHIAHAGHLVQIPSMMINQLVAYGCDYITVYSYEKLVEVNEAAKKIGLVQKVCVRVIGENDRIYSGQTAGFYLNQLEELVQKSKDLKYIEIAGVDNFPCFLYDEVTKEIQAQENLHTVFKAKKILEDLGCFIQNVNAPSATCVHTLELMKQYPEITSAEPGHGLSGTTPYHVDHDAEEIPSVLYLSEVSHVLDNHAYIYGGGYYRRGHIQNALIGSSYEGLVKDSVILPDMDSIDYHFGLENPHHIGDSAVLCFRYQIFVTRSDVCLIKGIHSGKPEIVGIYDSLGGKK